MMKINLKLKTSATKIGGLANQCGEKNLKLRKGQSIAEYAILISVVTMALLAMQVYMKRGIQSVVKYSTDQFGSQDWFESNPDRGSLQNTTLRSTSESTSRIQQSSAGSGVATTLTTNETSTNTGLSIYTKEEDR